jgi:hypothetical protein
MAHVVLANNMKTEKQIRTKLKSCKEKLIDVSAQFKEYDNHEDMETIMLLEREINILEWILAA